MYLDYRARERDAAFEIRCYRRLLNNSYKDHVTTEDVHGKTQAGTGKYNLTLVKKLDFINNINNINNKGGLGTAQGFWPNKDDSAGHSAKKKKQKMVEKIRGGKTVLKNGQGWTLLA